MMKIILKISFITVLIFINLEAQITEKPPLVNQSSAFAIVIDKATYSMTGDAVELYRDAVEKDGLSAYILIYEDGGPEEIRTRLSDLYKRTPAIEGAVFIGDIPIPMIRNAQHMTSAFKLQEDRYPFIRSSVPSDRYYDDFDLKFGFISRDTTDGLLYYYSLLPESPQKIEREIYTARIKAPVNDSTKYSLIRKYLQRISAQKLEKNPINEMLVYTGHGYYSESLAGWADERLSLREQFPQLYKHGNRMRILNHEMSDNMKEIIFREIQRPQLDVAVFHAHGTPDMQLLIDYPHGESVPGSIEAVKLYFRSKLRSAKDREETKEYFKKQYDVPDSWFEGAFVDSVIKADSLLSYSLDIYSADIDSISPGAEFIMFDECFNGSFHKENYIAGKYLFGSGTTAACEANTVNVLQDKWSDEHLGLLNKGVRIGTFHKYKNFLESHIIGDPTYRFHTEGDEDMNNILLTKKDDSAYWEKELNDSDPVIRSLAVEHLYKLNPSVMDSRLKDIYHKDASVNVRMHALKCLAESGGSNFYEVLESSIFDSYELIRKFSSIWMGETGRPEYIPFMIESIIRDESPRVAFNAGGSLVFIDNRLVSEGAMAYLDKNKDRHSVEIVTKNIIPSLDRNRRWLYDEMLYYIKSDTVKLKNKLQEVRTFRNYHFHEALPELLAVAKDERQDESLRTAVLEALGWFTLYYNKVEIKNACIEIKNNVKTPASVRDEAVRTLNRLTAGLNNVFIP